MSRLILVLAAAAAGFYAGWLRREDPFVKRYGYSPGRQQLRREFTEARR